MVERKKTPNVKCPNATRLIAETFAESPAVTSLVLNYLFDYFALSIGRVRGRLEAGFEGRDGGVDVGVFRGFV